MNKKPEKNQIQLCDLLKQFGMLYSEELGIDVERDPFKWFLASFLFGARISATIAKNTYKIYEREGLTTPKKLALADLMVLIRIHGKGGYGHYDGVTARYVNAIANKLLADYGGKITELSKRSKSPTELEARLLEFKGIGPVRAQIFLRELRGVWNNADPQLTAMEISTARHLKIIDSDFEALEKLKDFWRKNAVKGFDFRNFESALVRYGLKLRRRKIIKELEITL